MNFEEFKKSFDEIFKDISAEDLKTEFEARGYKFLDSDLFDTMEYSPERKFYLNQKAVHDLYRMNAEFNYSEEMLESA